MNFFRNKYVSHGLALFTGIVFLNMSFFLAEVSALKLDQDKVMVANIAKLIAGSSAEEEKDAFGGSTDEDATAKEIDLIFSYTIYTPDGFFYIAKSKGHLMDHGLPRLGNYEIYSPPPEV